MFLGILLGVCACDDGDLQIEEVDFDASNIETCAGLDNPTETTFFFKIDQDEALLLNLESGLIQNETSQVATLASSIPDASNLIYRFFSDNVTSAYFCDALPPLEPTVIKETTATAGDISVDSRVDTLTALTKNYSHTITITNLSLVNDQGEQLTDLSTLVYGDFSTQSENSANLAVPFSNFLEVASEECNISPNQGSLRLYKVINDEFIFLDVPNADTIFKNEATPDSIPIQLDLANSEIFKYVVLNTLANNDLACAASFGDDIKSWSLVSTSGILTVETVASEPDDNGTITYTHDISLENMVLTSKASGEGTSNVNLAAIPSVSFGTYITTMVQ
ncbi:hypothetical protein LCGC14_1325240 [marine sediment metagenome]